MDKQQIEASPLLYTADRDYTLVKGKGPYVWDETGKKILDFAAGIAVNFAGHSHPRLIKKVTEQIKQIGHISMTHANLPLKEVSKLLVDRFDPKGKIFWVNSGAEANEHAIKVIYYYQTVRQRPERDTIISFDGSFHGRTMRTLAATGKNMDGFGPAPTGFKRIPYNNIDALRAAVDERTAGIIVEPIQGEGGIIFPSKEFLQTLRELADKHDIVLSFDEVQAGLGRAGTFYAYERYGVKPDVITLAKALSGGTGIPVAAAMVSGKINAAITGDEKKFNNGTTYGGSAVAAAVALEVVKMLLEENNDYIGPKAVQNAAYMKESLLKLAEKNKKIVQGIRGEHFFLGIKLVPEYNNLETVVMLRKNSLFTMPAGENVIRLTPPLNVEKKHIDEAMRKLNKTFKEAVKAKKNAKA